MIFKDPLDFDLDLQDLEDPQVVSEQQVVVNNPAKNLSNKLDSILRSIENLTQKKVRLEYEIKKQKLSLARKRNELKRVQKSQTRKMRVSLESADPVQLNLIEQEFSRFQRRCHQLLTESQRILDTD